MATRRSFAETNRLTHPFLCFDLTSASVSYTSNMSQLATAILFISQRMNETKIIHVSFQHGPVSLPM